MSSGALLSWAGARRAAGHRPRTSRCTSWPSYARSPVSSIATPPRALARSAASGCPCSSRRVRLPDRA
eukprot:5647152-Alexandrium_andersonii.AAC.1